MTKTSKNNRILIFDTTMRDGEQSPGASMTLEEKLRIAEMLEAMGVDIIEAGFPIASNGDFEAVREVSKIIRNCTVAGLSRANAKDIDRAWEALKHAKRPRIHSVISTSPVHMKHKLQLEPDQVLDAVIASVTHARNLCDDVEWSAEDATRTEFDFLCRCIEAAIKAGATTVNIPDTVGYAMPAEYGKLIADLIANIPNSDKAVFSTHCHNDLGLAVANSLAAVANGARQVECTINGLGERAGNAALEEIVMALRVRSDYLPYTTDVVSENFIAASRMVSTATGFPVQFNKAIVGKNAFSHESGIHQDGMLKHTQTYEIMTPESVGVHQSSLVMGKHSGRHAFRNKIEEMGYQLGQNALEDAFVRFKELTDRKKQVYDEDIAALIDDTMLSGQDKIKVVSLQVIAGTAGPQSATLELNVDGEIRKTTATGNGPVDAIFNAIHALYPHEARLQLYQVHAVTEGTDAQAEVSVRLEQNGKAVTGQGADPDTLVASARAYVNALNRLLVKRDKTVPVALTTTV
ncbi:MAG TPA: 2-isopropylmalate synthase [Alphaproteobacteria bacterium]|nr:2-isopropylmalate synthase [Alphaproteobacteria bacterium]